MAYERLRETDYNKVPWEFKVSDGFSGRFKGIYSFGYNPSVSTTFEDIWRYGGDAVFLSSAETITVVSDSVNDDGSPPGTGAQIIKLEGLDNNYNYIEEFVTMDGVTPVITTKQFLRITKAFVTDVGTNGSNVGNITGISTISLGGQFFFEAGVGQTLKAINTIPAGFYGIITRILGSANGLDSAIIDFQTREFGKSWRVRHRASIPTAVEFNVEFVPLGAPLILPPKSDIKMRAIKVGAGSTIVGGSFSLYLIDEREVNT